MPTLGPTLLRSINSIEVFHAQKMMSLPAGIMLRMFVSQCLTDVMALCTVIWRQMKSGVPAALATIDCTMFIMSLEKDTPFNCFLDTKYMEHDLCTKLVLPMLHSNCLLKEKNPQTLYVRHAMTDI